MKTICPLPYTEIGENMTFYVELVPALERIITLLESIDKRMEDIEKNKEAQEEHDRQMRKAKIELMETQIGEMFEPI